MYVNPLNLALTLRILHGYIEQMKKQVSEYLTITFGNLVAPLAISLTNTLLLSNEHKARVTSEHDGVTIAVASTLNISIDQVSWEATRHTCELVQYALSANGELLLYFLTHLL